MKFLIAFAIASLLMVFIQIINTLRRKPRTTEEKVSEFGTSATTRSNFSLLYFYLTATL